MQKKWRESYDDKRDAEKNHIEDYRKLWEPHIKALDSS